MTLKPVLTVVPETPLQRAAANAEANRREQVEIAANILATARDAAFQLAEGAVCLDTLPPGVRREMELAGSALCSAVERCKAVLGRVG